jgi:enamine deaminase RidA (YjgF/YER057c/UK114 family)
MSKVASKLEELGLTLPAVATPVANYVPFKVVNNLIYTSGNTPSAGPAGKVGAELSVEEGYQAARNVGLRLIAILNAASGGELDRLEIVKVLGFVACAPGCYDSPKVINGCSDLLVEVFGEAGKHARSAVPASGLPGNAPVEIELIARFRD